MQISDLTIIILEINKLLDSGEHDDLSLDDAKQAIDNGTVLQLLADRGTGYLDHLKDTSTGDLYSKHLQAIYDAYAGDERKKWGIQNKGLCLLLAWTNELIQQGKGWQPADWATRD